MNLGGRRGAKKSCGGEYKNWVEGIEKGRRGEGRKKGVKKISMAAGHLV